MMYKFEKLAERFVASVEKLAESIGGIAGASCKHPETSTTVWSSSGICHAEITCKNCGCMMRLKQHELDLIVEQSSSLGGDAE